MCSRPFCGVVVSRRGGHGRASTEESRIGRLVLSGEPRWRNPVLAVMEPRPVWSLSEEQGENHPWVNRVTTQPQVHWGRPSQESPSVLAVESWMEIPVSVSFGAHGSHRQDTGVDGCCSLYLIHGSEQELLTLRTVSLRVEVKQASPTGGADDPTLGKPYCRHVLIPVHVHPWSL